jgi:hypothetical protein
MKAQTILNKPWVLGLIAFIIIANVPPIKNIYHMIFDEYHYRYSNENGSFTFVEFKARDTKMMYRIMHGYKQLHPQSKDTTAYRLFKKNILCFWRWGEYFYDKRYKMPYKSWKEIKRRRGYNLEYSNNLQDF